ncbi:MAG: tryptophan--tRNA ligase, partial [Planctomycetes bacterium]|nr:tryptophan--tRNA ligase [Planctomycetota bacterium]
MARVLSGIQPSGKLHLGNYAGAIRQFLDLQATNEMFVFVASYHALTSVRDPAAMRENIRQVVIDYLAYGLDPERTSIYLQQDVPEVTELCWLLSCVCPVSMMDKAVSYKDKTAKGLAANVGLYVYPILQAADILAVDAEIVPVGKDQVQHLEITRDLAGRFNHEFASEVFTLPNYRLAPDADVLPGVDGEKMSKSYGNTIDPFEDEKPLRKRVMGITTDSTPVEAAKDPETCTVYRMFRAIAGKSDARTLALAERYRAGGMGYGHAKQALFELLLDHFGPARARRAGLLKDPGYVDGVLARGAAAARAKA